MCFFSSLVFAYCFDSLFVHTHTYFCWSSREVLKIHRQVFFSSLPPFFSYGIYVNKRQMFFSGTHCHVHCILIKHLFFLFFHIFVVRCFVCWAWQTWNMLERIAYGTGPCVLCVGSMQSFVDCDKSSTLVLLLVTLFAWLEGVSFLKKREYFPSWLGILLFIHQWIHVECVHFCTWYFSLLRLLKQETMHIN